jgi:MtrB/PioB family decaheme-associated outer membrane protein
MRLRLLALTGGLLLGGTLQAAAQGASQDTTPKIGSFDFGARVSTVDGDRARFQRFRDLRGGGFLENFRYRRDTATWLFEAKLDHVGYRDQRYEVSFNRFGKIKASFQWDQVPLFYSTDTRTLYTETSPGVFRIDDAIQRGIETRTTTLANVAPLAVQFDLQQRRDIARFGLTATPTKDFALTGNVSIARRDGLMPWSASFGIQHAVELSAPLDQRTVDVNAAAEWGNERGSLRVQYDGSWFDNDVQTLIWDNPIKFTDSTSAFPFIRVAGDGTSQGRMAFWPNSTLNAISVTGTARLPARGRATAYVSFGNWNQDAPLLPFTINTAIQPIPLPRTTAQAEAQVTALSFSYTSRPTDRTWFNARYRRYDFDDQTPRFPVVRYVNFDQVIWPSLLGGTEPFGYARNFFDADFSYNITTFVALRAGYGLEEVDRTFRLTESTTEHAFRASIDSTGNNYVTVRGVYEHSTRTGSGLNAEVLGRIGEQVSLRQFDISDRDRDRVSTIVQVTPIAQLGLNATVGIGRDKRPDAYFGLQEAQTRFYSVGVDVVPSNVVSGGFTWGFDKYTSLQRSRQAFTFPPGQFNDPTRDWSADANERVHYITASVGLVKAIPKTDLQFGYDFNRSRSRYLYVLPANSTLPPPEQLPQVLNELHRGTLDMKYFFARHLAAGLVYWFDKYRVEDFALDPGAISRIDMPSALLLGYVWRPYTAHTVLGRLSYFW